jgi:DNA-binding transcriptional MerR regulator
MTTTTPPAAERQGEGMTIGAAADAAGLSVDAVRYYDRCGLLDDLARDGSGNRRFSRGDVLWLRVLRCLRGTGMSMQDLRRFVAYDGRTEPERRLHLLQAHRDAVRERIRSTEEQLEVVEAKIEAYRDLVGAVGAVGTVGGAAPSAQVRS